MIARFRRLFLNLFTAALAIALSLSPAIAQEIFSCDCLYYQQEKSRYICVMLQNSDAYKEFQKNVGNRYSLLAKPVTIVSKCQSRECSAAARYRHNICMCGTVSGNFVSLSYTEWSGGYDTHVLTIRPDWGMSAKFAELHPENYR
jgi:hypothetical protein